MKLVLAFLCCVGTVSIATAAECSLSELDLSTKLKTDPMIPAACAGLFNPAISTDASTLASGDPCSDECVAYLEKFVAQLPVCDVQGLPLKLPFETVIATCKASAGLKVGAVVPVVTATAAPASTMNATASLPTTTTGPPATKSEEPGAATSIPTTPANAAGSVVTSVLSSVATAVAIAMFLTA